MNNNTVKCIKVKIFPINQNECVYLLELPKLVLPSGVGNTPKIAISRICYGENGTVKFLETLPENVFRHNYSMVQIKKKINRWENFGVTQAYTLNYAYIFTIHHLPLTE